MIYKTLKKVSEYCQLLDKSKFPATQTVSGVTFTNNGDGTITVNGTATSAITVQINLINTTTDYRYLLLGCPSGGIDDNGNWIYRLRCFNGIGDEYGNGKIAYANKTGNTTVLLQINSGITVSNLTFKPQLFDLTEMYGAGNEPTTVEEFREKFPNELYDYKPYCFVKSYKTLLKVSDNKIITSYKKSLICTTKNLFDMPLTRGYPSNTTFENTTLRTFTVGTYIVGITRNNYYTTSGIGDFTVDKNKIKITVKRNGYGISIPLLLTVSNTYTVSCKADNNYYPNIGITFYKEDGTIISFTQSSEAIGTNPVWSFTVPENTYYTLILFYGRANNEYTFSNIQLEEGATATEYHPYGYL